MPRRNLAAAQNVLAIQGDNLSYAQGFTLFQQLVRDLLLSNLATARRELNKEVGRFFEGELRHFSTLMPAKGAELQRDAAALRRHMIEAARSAQSVGESPSTQELAPLEETLAAIGNIHQRSPTAALMVINLRDEDQGTFDDRIAAMASGEAKTGFRDRLAGMQSGDAARPLCGN